MKTFPIRTVFLLTLVLLAIIVPFCLFGASVDAWTDRLIAQATTHRFTTGALLTALLAVDIVMPVPSSLVSTACGLTLGFLAGTLASFFGMTLSAVAGYFMGRYAAVPVEKLIGNDELCMLKTFNARHGIWVLLALRPVPVLAEASMLFSGLARQPLPQVLAVTALGNLAVSAVYAAVGVWGRLNHSFLMAFGASVLLSGLLMLWLRRTRATPPVSPAE
jgi:uncharacterized membrane protein YdjX (TVP38/TMEM64 family)